MKSEQIKSTLLVQNNCFNLCLLYVVFFIFNLSSNQVQSQNLINQNSRNQNRQNQNIINSNVNSRNSLNSLLTTSDCQFIENEYNLTYSLVTKNLISWLPIAINCNYKTLNSYLDSKSSQAFSFDFYDFNSITTHRNSRYQINHDPLFSLSGSEIYNSDTVYIQFEQFLQDTSSQKKLEKLFENSIDNDSSQSNNPIVNLQIRFENSIKISANLKIELIGPRIIKPPIFDTASKNKIITITEDTVIGTVIGNIQAKTIEKSNNLYYVLDSVSSYFSVHPMSGDIILVGKLNYVSQNQHVMQISAIDRILMYLPESKRNSDLYKSSITLLIKIDKQKLTGNSSTNLVANSDHSESIQSKYLKLTKLNQEITSLHSNLIHYGQISLINLNEDLKNSLTKVKIIKQNIPEFIKLTPINYNNFIHTFDVILDLNILEEKNVNFNSRIFCVFRATGESGQVTSNTSPISQSTTLRPFNVNNQDDNELELVLNLNEILPEKKPRFIGLEVGQQLEQKPEQNQKPQEMTVIKLENFTPKTTVLKKFSAVSYDYTTHHLRYELYYLNTEDLKYLNPNLNLSHQKISNADILNHGILINDDLDFKIDTQGNLILNNHLINLNVKFLNENYLFVVISDQRLGAKTGQNLDAHQIKIEVEKSIKLQQTVPEFNNCQKINSNQIKNPNFSSTSPNQPDSPKRLCKLKNTDNISTNNFQASVVKLPTNLNAPNHCQYFRVCDNNFPFKNCNFAYFNTKITNSNADTLCQSYFVNHIFDPQVKINCNNFNVVAAQSTNQNDIVRFTCDNCLETDTTVNFKSGEIILGKIQPYSLKISAVSMLYYDQNVRDSCSITLNSGSNARGRNFNQNLDLQTDASNAIPEWEKNLHFSTFSPELIEIEGDLVKKLTASSASKYGPIHYEFVDDNLMNKYGFILLNNLLKYEGNNKYLKDPILVKIIAKNDYFTSRILNLLVKLPNTLLNNQDATHIKFTNNNHNFKISEDLPVGSIIGILETNLSPSKYDLRFSIDPINSAINIDDRSGILTLNQPLDYEKNNILNFRARVRFGSRKSYYFNHSLGLCNVTLIISDEAENIYITPKIPTSILVKIDEGHPIGHRLDLKNNELAQQILNRQANLKYQFTAISGTGLTTFSVNENTGMLKLLKNLNFISRNFYDLQIAICSKGGILYCNTLFLNLEIIPKNKHLLESIIDKNTAFFEVEFEEGNLGGNSNQPPIILGKFTTFQSDFRPIPRNCLVKNVNSRPFRLSNFIDSEMTLSYNANEDYDNNIKDYKPKQLKVSCNNGMVNSEVTILRRKIKVNKKSLEPYDINLPCSLLHFGFRLPVLELNSNNNIFMARSTSINLNSHTGHVNVRSCGSQQNKIIYIDTQSVNLNINYQESYNRNDNIELDFRYELSMPIVDHVVARLSCIELNNPNILTDQTNCRYTLDKNTPQIFQICNQNEICIRRFPWNLQDFGAYRISVIVGHFKTSKIKEKQIEIKLEDRRHFVPQLKDNVLIEIDHHHTGMIGDDQGSFVALNSHGKIPYNWYKMKITKVIPAPAGQIFTVDQLNRLSLRNSIQYLVDNNNLPNYEEIYIWITAENHQATSRALKDGTLLKIKVNWKKLIPPKFKNFGSVTNQIIQLSISKEVSVGYSLNKHWSSLPFPPAVDHDFNDRIEYSLSFTKMSTGNPSPWEDKFRVHPYLGYLYVNSDISELSGRRIAAISACDKNNNCAMPSARVEIMIVNDSTDQTHNLDVLKLDESVIRSGFDVPEDTLPGTVVANMNHIFQYQNSAVNFKTESEYFALNHYTGQLTLIKSVDAELISKIDLKILASYHEKSKEVTVTINIVDINDHTPIFENYYYEAIRGESFEIQVTDLDASDQFSTTQLFVSHYNVDHEFWYASGKTKNTFEIKTENFPPVSVLKITACDYGGRCTVQPAVILISEPTSSRTIPSGDSQNGDSNSPNNLIKSTVTCKVVLPILENQKICKIYHNFDLSKIRQSNTLFNLEENNWLVSKKMINNLPFTQFKIGSINIKLVQVWAGLELEVENDEKLLSVYENTIPSTSITTITQKPTSNQVIPKSISYKILNFPPSQIYIHPTSGQLFIKSELDRETTGDSIQIVIIAETITNQNYNQEFIGIDSGSPDLGHKILTLKILDDNDNAPEFVNLPYVANVVIGHARKTNLNQAILKIQAVDADSDPNYNAKVSYLADNSGSTPFPEWLDLDSETGEIRLISEVPLSFPANSSLTLSVIARDHGQRRQLQSKTTIQLIITNMVVPTFTAPAYSCVGDIKSLSIRCNQKIVANSNHNQRKILFVEKLGSATEEDRNSKNGKNQEISVNNALFDVNIKTGEISFTQDLTVLSAYLPIATSKPMTFNLNLLAIDENQPDARNSVPVEIVIPPNYLGVEVFADRIFKIQVNPYKMRSYEISLNSNIETDFLDHSLTEILILPPKNYPNKIINFKKILNKNKIELNLPKMDLSQISEKERETGLDYIIKLNHNYQFVDSAILRFFYEKSVANVEYETLTAISKIPIQENFPRNMPIYYLKQPKNIKFVQSFPGLENSNTALVIYEENCHCLKLNSNPDLNLRVDNNIYVKLRAIYSTTLNKSSKEENYVNDILLPDIVLPILPKKRFQINYCQDGDQVMEIRARSSINLLRSDISINPRDEDQGYQQVKIINSQGCSDYFDINKKSGQVFLLDHDRVKDLYAACHGNHIQVKVTHHNFHQTCSFKLKPSNLLIKEAPIFTANKYEATLSQGQVLKITAYESNSEFSSELYPIKYSLLGLNNSPLETNSILKNFQIDPTTGEISIIADITKKKEDFKFQVQAEFVGHHLIFSENLASQYTSFVPVSIKVIKNKKFDILNHTLKLEVSLNSPRGSNIYTLPDNILQPTNNRKNTRKFTYINSLGNTASFFIQGNKIIQSADLSHRAPGEKIYLSMDVKRGQNEANQEYQVQIEITLVDEKIKRGFIQLNSEYVITASELDPVNSKIGSLNLNAYGDNVRACIYDLNNQAKVNPVLIQDLTGDIILKNNLRGTTTFNVLALNNKACPTSISRNKNLNDLASKITIQILTENKTPPVFENNLMSDFSGSQNSNSLNSIKNNNFVVRENSAKNTIIGSLKLYDTDKISNSLSVTIKSGDDLDIFEVEVVNLGLDLSKNRLENKVLIKLKRPNLIYKKLKSSYYLELLAFDGYHQVTTTVNILVEELYNIPQCSSSHLIYNVNNIDKITANSLRTPPKSYLNLPDVDSDHYDVSFVSQDNEILLKLSGSKTRFYFVKASGASVSGSRNSVDSTINTGIYQAKMNLISKLDSDLFCEILITVVVRNLEIERNLLNQLSLISTSNFESFQDLDMSDPDQEIVVSTNTEIGKIVGLIQPKSSNVMLSLNAKTGQSVSNTFTVERDTGLIVLNKKLNANPKQHLLDVQIISMVGAGNKMKVVTIKVLDQPNQQPIFQQENYVWNIESDEVNTATFKVSALPQDKADTVVKYQLNHENFKIDTYSGEISIISELKYRNYNLQVKAIGATSKLISKTTIAVTIKAVNHNQPYLQSYSKIFYTDELLSPLNSPKLIGKLHGADADLDSSLKYFINSKNYFGIYTPQQHEKFKFFIRQDEIFLKTGQILDFESVRSYTLPVIISDGKFNTSDSVQIYVNNLNDSPPQLKFYENENTIFYISKILGGKLHVTGYGTSFTFTCSDLPELEANGINLESNGDILVNFKNPNLDFTDFQINNLKISDMHGNYNLYPVVRFRFLPEPKSIDIIDKNVIIPTVSQISSNVELGQLFVRDADLAHDNHNLPSIGYENYIYGTNYELNKDSKISISKTGKILMSPSKNMQFNLVKMRPRVKRHLGSKILQDTGLLNIDTRMITDNMLNNLVGIKNYTPETPNFWKILSKLAEKNKIEILAVNLKDKVVYFAIRTAGDNYLSPKQVLEIAKSKRIFQQLTSPIYDCQVTCKSKFGNLAYCTSKIVLDEKSKMVLYDTYDQSYLLHTTQEFKTSCSCKEKTLLFPSSNTCRNPCEKDSCHAHQTCEFRPDFPPWYRSCKDNNSHRGTGNGSNTNNRITPYPNYNFNDSQESLELTYHNQILGMSKNSNYKISKIYSQASHHQKITSLKLNLKIRTKDQIATVFKITLASINIEGTLMITNGKFVYYIADQNGSNDKKITGLQNKLTSDGDWQDLTLSHKIYDDRITVNMLMGSAMYMDKGQIPITQSLENSEKIYIEFGNKEIPFVGCIKDIKLAVNSDDLTYFNVDHMFNVKNSCISSEYYLGSCFQNCYNHGYCQQEWNEQNNVGSNTCVCDAGYDPEDHCQNLSDSGVKNSKFYVFVNQKILGKHRYFVMAGVLVFLILIILVAWCCCCRCKNKKKKIENNKRHGQGTQNADTEFVVGQPAGSQYELNPEREALLSTNPSAPPSYRSDLHLRPANQRGPASIAAASMPQARLNNRIINTGYNHNYGQGISMSEAHYNNGDLHNNGFSLVSPTQSQFETNRAGSSVSSMTSLASSAFAMNEKIKRKKLAAKASVPPHQRRGPRSLPSTGPKGGYGHPNYHNSGPGSASGQNSYNGSNHHLSNGYHQPRLGIQGKSVSSRHSINNSADEMSDTSSVPSRQFNRSRNGRRRENLPLDSIMEADHYNTNQIPSRINSKQNISTSRTNSQHDVNIKSSHKKDRDPNIIELLNQNITHNITTTSSEALNNTPHKKINRDRGDGPGNAPSREPSFNNKNMNSNHYVRPKKLKSKTQRRSRNFEDIQHRINHKIQNTQAHTSHNNNKKSTRSIKSSKNSVNSNHLISEHDDLNINSSSEDEDSRLLLNNNNNAENINSRRKASIPKSDSKDDIIPNTTSSNNMHQSTTLSSHDEEEE